MTVLGIEALTWQQLTSDPVLFYSASAALLLALVSLLTGLFRGDLLVLTRPRQALRVFGAVLLGFLLMAAAEQLALRGAEQWASGILRALARVPLYVVTLAFGPSVGLVCGAMFAAATAGGNLPGPAEALFAFELVVLGWLAIYPSPRMARWAGPFDVLVARVLTWGTAGVAWLALRDGGVTMTSVLESSSRWPWGLLVSALALYAIAPSWYAAAFPHSRIAPDAPPEADASPAASENPDGPGTAFKTGEWTRSARTRAGLANPTFDADDPNG